MSFSSSFFSFGAAGSQSEVFSETVYPIMGEGICAQQTLRMSIINSYPRKVTTTYFHPQIDLDKVDESVVRAKFNENLVYWIDCINKQPKSRTSGVWYPQEYMTEYGSTGDKLHNINALANDNYFDITHFDKGCYFIEKGKESTPSELLEAFFVGPTMADCGSLLQACMYRAIEQLVGTDKFNNYFSTPLTPFTITPYLFDPVLGDDPSCGNPLYWFFEDFKMNTLSQLTGVPAAKESLDESEVEAGDVLHLQGVTRYGEKHLSGAEQGWNLICAGKNGEGENLYLGFGTDEFKEPLTYSQVKGLLVTGYNRDQNSDTKDFIDRKPEDPKIIKAKELAADEFGEEEQIGGIITHIRFNSSLFKHLLNTSTNKPWHEDVDGMLEVEAAAGAAAAPVPKVLRFIIPFSSETQRKDFGNYEITNDIQSRMSKFANSFARKVIAKDDRQPVGLIMTGLPGIGKTHLCVSVAKKVVAAGKNVLFLDSKSVGDFYQKYAEEHDFKPMTDDELNRSFDEWLKDIDLIVFDDINNEYGFGNTFLKKALDYTLNQNKAIMLSSNEPINIKKNLSKYYGYQNPATHNFKLLTDLNGISYRKAWWDKFKIPIDQVLTLPLDRKLSYFNSPEVCATGFIATSAELPDILGAKDSIDDLEKVKRLLYKTTSLDLEKVKVLGNPYEHRDGGDKISPDYYLHDSYKYDAVILRVNNFSEAVRFISILSKIHDEGKKVVILTDDKTKCCKLLDDQLSYSSCDAKRLGDRLSILLPEYKNYKDPNPSTQKREVRGEHYNKSDARSSKTFEQKIRNAFKRNGSSGLFSNC